MKYLFLLLVAVSIYSCEGDDDSKMPLDYTICGGEILAEENRLDQKELTITEWPATLRFYTSSEFPGFSISSVLSYNNAAGLEFFLATMDNNGQLLFDGVSAFVCGDESFTVVFDDENILYEDLPQKIRDYITANYPNLAVQEAEFDDGAYDIELTDGTQICFDSVGNFLGEC